jgi:hypothetical protein
MPMRSSPDTRARHAPPYALDTLHALPCGCVAAVFRSQPGDVEMVSLEARGPHCVYSQHQTGRVLGLGMNESDRLSR